MKTAGNRYFSIFGLGACMHGVQLPPAVSRGRMRVVRPLRETELESGNYLCWRADCQRRSCFFHGTGRHTAAAPVPSIVEFAVIV